MISHQNKLNISKMRNLIQLKKSGMDLSTTSNEVAKLWDSFMFQWCGYFEAPETNGIQGCLESIQSIDPDFPLIKLITFDLSSENFESNLNNLKIELKKQFENNNLHRKWTEYEKIHMKAFIFKLEGYDECAAECWLDQVVQHPQDLLALKYLNDHYIITGTTPEISNLFLLCRQEMSSKDIYYPFILGYEAFGLEEKGHLNEALKLTTESLDICSWNSWAIHTMAHIYESNGNSLGGIEFMNRTKPNWINSTALACHNMWHTSLFYLNEGDINSALDVWDTDIMPRLNSQYSHFSMSDAVALLTRIELLRGSHFKSNSELNITERWSVLSSCIGRAVNSFGSCEFYDAHLALAMLGCNQQKDFDRILERCSDWIMKYENRIFNEWECDSYVKMFQARRAPSDRFITRSHRLLPFLEAMKCFHEGDYQATVNLLYPLRKELRRLGGSNAQNDLFYQFLAAALLNAGGHENQARLKMLLLNRKDVNECNNYYQRMEKSIINYL